MLPRRTFLACGSAGAPIVLLLRSGAAQQQQKKGFRMKDERAMAAAESAAYLVVGGGVMGVSAAYHLAQAGAGRVVLIERDSELATRTTHGAAGFIAPWWCASRSPGPELAIERYGMALYRELASRHPIGLCANGLVHIATTPASDAAIRRDAATARGALGESEAELLEPDDLRALVPIVERGRVASGLLVRGAFSLRAADAIRALAAEFVQLGGEIRTGTAVERLLIADQRICGVQTSAGAIEADGVVLAAGAWLGQLSQRAGVPLPLLATQASRFVTQPHAGIPANMPMLMFPAYHNLYLRPEAGGLLIGCEETVIHPPTLQADLAAIAGGGVPETGSAGVPAGGDSTHSYHLWLARAFASVVPLLATIAVREVRMGSPTRVPDMRHICGAAADVAGLYLLGADLECGMTHGPGLGRMLAQQILGHQPATPVYRPDRWGAASA